MRLLVLLLMTASLSAQILSGVTNPTVVQSGQQVALTVTAVQNVTLASGCVWRHIVYGSPSGPAVLTAFCHSTLPLTPGGAATFMFNVGNFAPGVYYFTVPYTTTGLNLLYSFFCFEIRSPGQSAPTLTAAGPAQRGQPLVMDLNAPGLAGVPYVAAASFTSDTGTPVAAGLVACLDQDALFALSLPVAAPGLFANFSGFLDGSGTATGLTLNIPNIPALQWFPLKIQAGIVDPVTTTVALSNGLSFTVQ